MSAPFGSLERLIALRYLRARRREGFISVIAAFSLLGIVLGVGTLIVVMSVMNGFQQELLSRILGLGGHLNVYAERGALSEPEEVARRLTVIPGVISTVPLVEGQVIAVGQRNATAGGVVRGIASADFERLSLLENENLAGELSFLRSGDTVAVGRRLAERLGVREDDAITLISPRGRPTVFGTMPTVAQFRIGVVFEIGMFDFDNTIVFMPYESAQAFFRLGDGATSVEMRIEDPQAVREARLAVAAAAGRPVRVVDWKQTNAGFFNAVEVERNVMFLILTLIILVAALNIISSMMMLVKDKGRDIAILRSMGARRATVTRIFLMTGSSIGVVGALLGLGLGLLFAENIESLRRGLESLFGITLFPADIYFLTELPALIDWTEVGYIVAMAIGLSILATFYPAVRAARMDPVEALRYE